MKDGIEKQEKTHSEGEELVPAIKTCIKKSHYFVFTKFKNSVYFKKKSYVHALKPNNLPPNQGFTSLRRLKSYNKNA